MPTRIAGPARAVIARSTRALLTVSQYKKAIDIEGTSDTADDDVILMALEAATAAIATVYGRQFYRTTDTRYFIARSGGYLDVPDLIFASEIAVDVNSDLTYSRALAVTDYVLEPPNDFWHTRVSVAPLAMQGFWPGYRVRITGDWGIVSVWGNPPVEQAPPDVAQAVQILAHRLVRRKDAPFGIIGGSDLGSAVRLAQSDPDVNMLLAPYRRSTGVLIA
jgi:hypothetical protein